MELDNEGISGHLAYRKSRENGERAFIEFCELVHGIQSMRKAEYLYDNASMERYFNTLKNGCTNLYEFATEDAFYQNVEEFAYVDYNHVYPPTVSTAISHTIRGKNGSIAAKRYFCHKCYLSIQFHRPPRSPL